eukprot:1173459-Prymnesium_polylepis.1
MSQVAQWARSASASRSRFGSFADSSASTDGFAASQATGPSDVHPYCALNQYAWSTPWASREHEWLK